ncbi:MoxR family ATPase [Thalassolituus sp.]|jgi:MoxR-like ATPase|uniref:AAA family ATPase n=1 Tax=Thalassolituus sp. TaxID=2030822 RepID=UPI00243A1209|nr:AAA family ATPase [Thalassolituus sp.]MEC8907486.1 AAA family ATPase [Pseudomonadota bacterium]MED5441521.1 AAA family ATPase [Pseudomonadota bacterium]MEE3159814.1 AAA family ATPase [Pseudomonadota bacterium]MEE3208363.1 AAA family ATPase [Pseudomonadota bacterium]
MSAIERALSSLSNVILGKNQQLKLSMCCLLADGHLLIEDLPGMGKTTLSHALAQVFGLKYSRIQFTSDLLPADIIGVSIFEKNSDSGEGAFRFHQGPVFAQVVLADEINRATAKSQSALLEAMEERQVTVEGQTRLLPDPFFVIATQNPTSQAGTFPLPESQLDRFLMCISLGYPDQRAERELLEGVSRRHLVDDLQTVINSETLVALRRAVDEVKASPAVLDYLQRMLAFSRNDSRFTHGLSPRAGIALLRAAKAWAVIDGRSFLIPEDLQAVLASVVDHRLKPGAARHILENVAALA